MNQTQNATVTTVRLTDDVRKQLAAWAAANLTSLAAELIRSVRERAEREKAKAEAV